MKIYDIIDKEQMLSVGCLIYFEKEKSFIIELQEYLDEWSAPLLFAQTVKKGKYTIGRELSKLWIDERIIPSGRQNIDSILANAQMTAYDEMMLLAISGGKCSQDNLYIKKLTSLPEYVLARMRHNLVECVPCAGHSLLCFFDDGSVRKVDIIKEIDSPEIKKIVSKEDVFLSVHIAAGGYCVVFNDSIDIDASTLYGKGVEIPLSLNDFLMFAQTNIIDTSECCFVLDCSRQNLSNYIAKASLTPVKNGVKGNLYTKGNVYRNELLASGEVLI